MELLKMILAAVLLVYFFCQIAIVMSDDPSDISNTSSASVIGSLNERVWNKYLYCEFGDFTSSIADILNNISSNNTIVNITTDVILSSNMALEGLENIVIIGDSNPVVKCNDVGAVKFISCKNIPIECVHLS